MTFDSSQLHSKLQSLTSDAVPLRWLVAFSGGIDSTVLLHALSTCRPSLQQEIVAIHIDHGLHTDSALWAEHCRSVASEFQVGFVCRQATVSASPDGGIEAAAREARYDALHDLVLVGDCLLSAHHEDDQAETLLLNLLRGSGLAGIAGIGVKQAFSAGHLLRPMLGFSSEAIMRYAEQQKLTWLDDPSNADARFDRNFLRQEVMPVLASRWPAAAARFKQSADLASESSELLRDLADLDLQQHDSAARLAIPELQKLSFARQRNLLRRAIYLCGLPPPPASRLYQAVHELIPAREDAQPLITWRGAELRRYRDDLFVMAELECGIASENEILYADGQTVDLGPGMGSLHLAPVAAPGIDPALARRGLSVRYRRGGEEIRLQGHDCTHKLKKLLQQDGVLPWMRGRLPLLYAENDLVAVADFWIAAEYAAQQGLRVCWDNPPALR